MKNKRPPIYALREKTHPPKNTNEVLSKMFREGSMFGKASWEELSLVFDETGHPDYWTLKGKKIKLMKALDYIGKFFEPK